MGRPDPRASSGAVRDRIVDGRRRPPVRNRRTDRRQPLPTRRRSRATPTRLDIACSHRRRGALSTIERQIRVDMSRLGADLGRAAERALSVDGRRASWPDIKPRASRAEASRYRREQLCNRVRGHAASRRGDLRVGLIGQQGCNYTGASTTSGRRRSPVAVGRSCAAPRDRYTRLAHFDRDGAAAAVVHDSGSADRDRNG